MNCYVYAYLDASKDCTLNVEGMTFIHEPFYIGVGTGERMFDHLHFALKQRPDKNLLKYNYLRKLIESGQLPIIQKLVEFDTREEANAFEISLIANIGTRMKVDGVIIRGPLVNLRAGGQGGSHAESTKKKLREKALIASPIQNARPEVREKLRQTTTAARANNPEWNKKLSEAISKANSRPDKRAKQSETMKGRKLSDETKAKLRALIPKAAGSIWINNGTVCKRITPNELEAFISKGWKCGRKLIG